MHHEMLHRQRDEDLHQCVQLQGVEQVCAAMHLRKPRLLDQGRHLQQAAYLHQRHSDLLPSNLLEQEAALLGPLHLHFDLLLQSVKRVIF
jgi:hypothetical protein